VTRGAAWLALALLAGCLLVNAGLLAVLWVLMPYAGFVATAVLGFAVWIAWPFLCARTVTWRAALVGETPDPARHRMPGAWL